MLEISTKRLLMRQFRQSDFEIYAAFYANPETARFVGGQMNRNNAWRHMAAILGHWTLKGFGYWAVEELVSGDFIGCVGLAQPSGWPEIELGYWITVEKQRQGYAREACLRARVHAYAAMGLTTLVSYIDPTNQPSIDLAQDLGAVREDIIDLAGFGPHGVYRHPLPHTSQS